ncbi:MAG: hypothetical protein E3J26_03535 [Candidatus Zixiibacteriota bacterium]|nr:MAG: hypothetical protein E3J26_03535 [candidate division Zixibacteria bacterium]
MIEALIRDDTRLVCLITIQDGPDGDSLRVDVYIPSKGQTLSGLMPSGGGELQQVALAIMTVYPVSALPKPDLRPASQILKENAIPLSSEMIDSRIDADKGVPVDSKPAPDLSIEVQRVALDNRMAKMDERNASLDKRWWKLVEREKKLEQDIENLRKSHPGP